MQDGIVTGDGFNGSPERRRRWALFVVLVGQFMLVLDTSIVSIALRAIQSDLGLHAADLTWVTTAYLIAFGGLLLLFGRLSDFIGRRRVFLIGMWIFTLASVACGLSSSAFALIASRFIQGIGAAAASSVTLAIIATEYPVQAERVKAMSAYALVSVCGGSAGLLVGGLLMATTSWHSIFLINVPIGLLAIRLGASFLREDASVGQERSVDVMGAVLVTGGAMTLIYTLVAVADEPLTHPSVWGPALVSVVFLATFAVLQARLTNPLVPPRIWRVRSLVVSSFVRAVVVMAVYGAWFLGALEMAHALAFDPWQIGMAFLPQTVTTAIMSLGPTVKLIARFGARNVLIFGLSAFAVAVWSLSLHGLGTSYFPWRFGSYLLMGIAAGCSFLPLTVIAMADVPLAEAGLGSAIINVSQQLAAALGLAVLGSIAAYRTHLLNQLPQLEALVAGYHGAYRVASVCLVIGIIVLALWLRERRPGATAAPVSTPMVTE